MPRPDLTVAIVDDNPSEIRLMTEALQETFAGITIRGIINGLEAVQELTSATRFKRPDVVILDYIIPMMHGLGFLRTLAGHPAYADVPLIVWSGNIDPRISEECALAGADIVRTKPYDYPEYLGFAKEIQAICRRGKSAGCLRAILGRNDGSSSSHP